MQQMSRLAKVDTGQQRKIVGGLQQPEVIEDRGFAYLVLREARIGSNLPQERLLKGFLLLKKLVEPRQLGGRYGRTVGVVGQQTVGVHGDEQRRVGIFGGDETNRTVAHG